MPLHWDIRVTGRVQGVFYRASARAEAERLGLQGFVRNETDGSVYDEAEGEAQELEAFLEWCRQGPPHAWVESVAKEAGVVKGFAGFKVR